MKAIEGAMSWLSVVILLLVGTAWAADRPGRVVFPGEGWVRITPEQAGIDVAKFETLLSQSEVGPGGWGGHSPDGDEWGAVLTPHACPGVFTGG